MCCVTVSVVTCECVDLIVHYTAYPVTLTDLIPVKCHSARRTTCVVKEARALEAVAYPAPRRGRRARRGLGRARAWWPRRRLGRREGGSGGGDKGG